MSNIDIEDIEEKLHKRLYYANKKDEENYNSERKQKHDIALTDTDLANSVDGKNSIDNGLDESTEKKKLMNIRKILKDDEGFNKIEGFLPDIENMITEKKKELNLLTGPTEANYFKTAYTRVTGNKNTADIAKEEFLKKKKDLNSEITRLQTIKTNINKLSPIYRFNEDIRDEELQKNDVIITANDMQIGKKYKLQYGQKYGIVTLIDWKKHHPDNDLVELKFSDNSKTNVHLDYKIIEVAQEGGKRKTRRQRKSRNMRRRKSNRRR